MPPERLRLAILAPPWFPVPPTGYGGVERVVALLADGLAERGHDVTLFASGDSRPKRAKLSALYDVAPSEHVGETLWDICHALSCFARQDEFDLVNDHSGMLAAAIGGCLHTPFVHTVHGPLTEEYGSVYERLCALSPNVRLVSVSESQRRPKPELPWLATCPNALDLESYPYNPDGGPDDYLLFVGRLSPEKGADRAVDIARATGLPLKIAGKCREPLEREFFDERVRPQLGPGIEYLGEVAHDRKIELLQHARALLFPIEWEEPFGLVMIEAMACGTPVVATRWGAAPEVIADGVSGFVVDDHHAFPAAIAEAERLDRATIRRYVEERFAAERMVADYERAYRLALA